LENAEGYFYIKFVNAIVVFMKYIIYTDGGSRGNPGPSGAGAVIQDEKGTVLKESIKYTGEQTNNFAEYEAVVLGLEELKKIVKEKDRKNIKIEIRMDSELIQRQLKGEYQIKVENLFGQYIKVHNMQVKHFPNITFTHIPREKNSHADKLANDAMDKGE
jgi:ribonuclease HI